MAHFLQFSIVFAFTTLAIYLKAPAAAGGVLGGVVAFLLTVLYYAAIDSLSFARRACTYASSRHGAQQAATRCVRCWVHLSQLRHFSGKRRIGKHAR